MKNIIIVFILLISAFGVSQEKLDKSLLWKISGKDINTSYLFGTIHATCDNTLNKKVLQVLKDTKNLYLELDMDDMAMQMKATQYMMMKEGKTIKSLTTEEEYKLLDSFLTKETGMSLAMFNTVKPFFISSTILPKMLDCPMKSVEAGLMAQVKTENEDVYGLEKIEDQFAAFDAVPLKEQKKN